MSKDEKQQKDQGVCPHCGYCPHCGQSPQQVVYPAIPYPAYPGHYYREPFWMVQRPPDIRWGTFSVGTTNRSYTIN